MFALEATRSEREGINGFVRQYKDSIRYPL